MTNLNTSLSELISKRIALLSTLPLQKEINTYLQNHSLIIDQIIKGIYQQCQFKENTISIYATGGYARNELFIHSDVDLIILHNQSIDGQTEQKLSDLLMQLWDLKIPVSHYIGSTDDLMISAAGDLNRYTNLLEMRHIAGIQLSENIFAKFIEQKSINAFYQEKMDEQKFRHKNYGETSYMLEPNVKESPGGLRDIQTLNWLMLRICHQYPTKDLLTSCEQEELSSYINYFNYLRWVLHYTAKRAEERLLFEYQKQIATLLSYTGQTINEKIEKLMNEYYLTTKKSNTLLDIWAQAINEELKLNKDYIVIDNQKEINANPSLILNTFQYMADNPQFHSFSVASLRYLRDLSQKIDTYRTDTNFNQAFIQLVNNTQNLETALRLMHRYDLLGAYLPDFQRLTGRMQYDLFHVYTVDKHLLTIIKMLCFFEKDAAETDYKNCHELIKQIPDKLVLRLAGLFHDIGKGLAGDHSELGADICQRFAAQHKLSGEQTELLIWLVKNHLLMSITAQKKDIYDPDVIEQFAKIVKTQNRLNYLYVLTVADIIATNPKLWNSWKATLLQQLYKACVRCFQDEENQYPTDTVVSMTQQHALAMLTEQGFDKEMVQTLWQNWQEKYFLRHSAQSVVEHTKAILKTKDANITVLVNDLAEQKTFDVFVYMQDKPLIVASTACIFDKLQLSIAEAQILTAKNNYTLDSYVLIKTDATKNNLTSKQIQQTLLKTLSGNLTSPVTNKRFISRRQRHFTIKTEINFQLDSQNNRTVMSLITTDTTGLVATITKAFAKHKIQIQHAKIATMGERAEDTFFIVDNEKQPLSEVLQKSLHETIVKLLGE